MATKKKFKYLILGLSKKIIAFWLYIASQKKSGE
jgi:hypothetical protein